MRAKFSIAKYQGNGEFDWAVFQDGVVIPGLTKLTRLAAGNFRDQLRAQVRAGKPAPLAVSK